LPFGSPLHNFDSLAGFFAGTFCLVDLFIQGFNSSQKNFIKSRRKTISAYRCNIHKWNNFFLIFMAAQGAVFYQHFQEICWYWKIFNGKIPAKI